MKKDEYTLAMLTVYQYSKNKVKCDYSIIPVSRNFNGDWQSGVSKEIIANDGFRLMDSGYIKFDKQKEGDGCKVSIITTGSIEEVENEMLKKLYKEFTKHFWYKLKYKKFLNKKKRLGQINF